MSISYRHFESAYQDSTRHLEILTLAIKWDSVVNVYNYGWAVCSKNDLYVKRVGNKIALCRMDKKPPLKFNVVKQEEDEYSVVEEPAYNEQGQFVFNIQFPVNRETLLFVTFGNLIKDYNAAMVEGHVMLPNRVIKNIGNHYLYLRDMLFLGGNQEDEDEDQNNDVGGLWDKHVLV